jgi:hypothetical protein
MSLPATSTSAPGPPTSLSDVRWSNSTPGDIVGFWLIWAKAQLWYEKRGPVAITRDDRGRRLGAPCRRPKH